MSGFVINLAASSVLFFIYFFFFLQGITYDTGGADIKAGGFMAGMHRDKCGAAAVAGFFQVEFS